MGVLRTVLAIAVVVFHSYKLFGLRLCGGQVAVQSFYMISGFYMALVLNEKYTGKGSYRTFIKSRFFRIFPVYWSVLLCAVLISIIGYYGFDKPYYLTRFISNKDCLSFTTVVYFVLENIIIIGQDVLYFLRLNELCHPLFTYTPLYFKHTGYQYLFVPQAWSISIECVFYLLAPFMVTKKIKWQLLILVLSLTLRIIYAKGFGLSFDPWTYRFLPFELAFFLAGSLAYRYYKILEYRQIRPLAGYTLLGILVILITVFNEIAIEETIKSYLFYVIFLGSLPYIFNSFKNNKADRYIGELSFSIYITHHLIVFLLRSFFFSHTKYMNYYGYSVILISVALAFVMQKWLVDPLDKYRQKRFS